MAETSRGRVTITLGRTGQVVKRASDVDFSDSLLGAGSKRSVRDRLGSNLDSSSLRGSHVNSKRQRGNTMSSNGVDALRIGKDDLRFKLLQKKSDDDKKNIDLRERLSRTGQPPPSRLDIRQRMPEPKDNSILGQISSTRSADNLPQINSSRHSFSPWTLDHLRRRSPDPQINSSRHSYSSRGLSPPRTVEELQRRPLSGAFDDVRAVSMLSSSRGLLKDSLDDPRSVSTSPFMTKPTLPTGSAKPAPLGPPRLGQLSLGPPPSGIVQKSSYMGEEQQTVDSLLHSLGLGKYAILFKAEEVDMTALKQMGENDLKELGIPMGPRKKIILALLPRSKRQP